MRRGRDETGDGPELVSATEIASFVFCAEAWRLEHGLGLPPGNRAERLAGNRHHRRKAAAERVAGGSPAVGRGLVVLASLGMLLLWVLNR